MSSVMDFVQGQRWLQGLDDISATNVICQALQYRPAVIPTVVEFAAALCAPGLGMSMPNGIQQEVPAGIPGRFTGIIKSFNDEKGYGFVFCQDVMDAHGTDVYLHRQQRQNLPVGSHVVFDIKLSEKGQPQACGLEPAAAPAAAPAGLNLGGQGFGGFMRPDGGKGQGKRMGARMTQFNVDEQPSIGENRGMIKSFSEQNGFGFIECLDLKSQGHNDVFLHHRQLDGHSVGDQVIFVTFLNAKGQPQAKELRLADADAEAPAAKKLRMTIQP